MVQHRFGNLSKDDRDNTIRLMQAYVMGNVIASAIGAVAQNVGAIAKLMAQDIQMKHAVKMTPDQLANVMRGKAAGPGGVITP